ncbi:MAG: M28 family metallopeptidase [Halioglobus sp.]
MIRVLTITSLAMLLVACDQSAQTEHAVTIEPEASAVTALDVTGGRHPIEVTLHRHIAELASDAYEGRAPGTAGEQKTLDYLVQEFTALRLEPGNKGSWYQKVPITSVASRSDASMALRGSEFSADLAYGSQMMVSTQRQVEAVSVSDSQLVFVGYGINAPERDWNDYAGLDMSGKTAVVLINDPGFATQDPELFNGNTMTYYGRWDYKYAEAARQGAAAVIIVHETAAAAYGWEVVENSWSGAKTTLTAQNKNEDKLAVEAWVPMAEAERLFAGAGLDFQALRTAAALPGFTGVALADIELSVDLANTVTQTTSSNIAAVIPGTAHSDEVVIYTAHWDHLGVRPSQEGDNIYNGASDNASGVAALFALAEQFKAHEKQPERTVMFLAVTAEESGLLGSKWYGENPIFAPASTVANFNMDNIAAGTIGETRDIAVVGYGNSELENYLADAANAQGRVVVQEPYPEKGYYYRSDHFSLAKQGIPALYLTRSTDSVEHGREWGDQRLKAYTANDYHKPSDEYDPSWDLSGAVQEVQLLFFMGNALANNRDFPDWNEGVEFKEIRDRSMTATQQ